tara:strand:+ start:995 stop:1543 length:549 start_codon:yes stop_codon:yes gene_type:complete
MENIESYTFNNLARIKEDKTYVSKRESDNIHYSDYTTINFHDSIESVEDVALSQPNINISGIYGPDGNESHVIDSDSYLKKAELTNLNNKIDLHQRPFLTTPYLGKGVCEINVESMLRKGPFTNVPNSCGSLTEETSNNIVPMVPNVKNSITNPKYLVEGVADPNWVRGGVMTRNHNYSSKK